MVASDLKYVVQLKTELTEDGQFRPWVSVIRQDEPESTAHARTPALPCCR